MTQSVRKLGSFEEQGLEVENEYRVYNFDSIGNRITATEGTTEISYERNEINQYTAVNGAGLTYDDDGNLTLTADTHYEYDAENRLITIEPTNPEDGDVGYKFV